MAFESSVCFTAVGIIRNGFDLENCFGNYTEGRGEATRDYCLTFDFGVTLQLQPRTQELGICYHSSCHPCTPPNWYQTMHPRVRLLQTLSSVTLISSALKNLLLFHIWHGWILLTKSKVHTEHHLQRTHKLTGILTAMSCTLCFSCCLFPLLLSAQPCPRCAGNRPFPGLQWRWQERLESVSVSPWLLSFLMRPFCLGWMFFSAPIIYLLGMLDFRCFSICARPCFRQAYC